MSLQAYTATEWKQARAAHARWVARGRAFTGEDVLFDDAYRLLETEAELADIALRLGAAADAVSSLAGDSGYRLSLACEIVETAAGRLIAAYTCPRETAPEAAGKAPRAISRTGKAIILPRKS